MDLVAELREEIRKERKEGARVRANERNRAKKGIIISSCPPIILPAGKEQMSKLELREIKRGFDAEWHKKNKELFKMAREGNLKMRGSKK